jgi:hypothetical protein
MRDKKLKPEDLKDSDTLGGAGEGRHKVILVPIRDEDKRREG